MRRLFTLIILFALLSQSAGAGPLDFLRTGKGTLRMMKFVADKFTFTNVAGNVTLIDGVAHIDMLSANAMGGGVRGKVLIDLNCVPPTYDVEIDLLDCKAEEFKKQINVETYFINGIISGHLRVTGAFDKHSPTMRIVGNIKMIAGPDDILTNVETEILYTLHHLRLNNFTGREPFGGTVTGNLEVIFGKEELTRLVGKIEGTDLGLPTLLRIGKTRPDWIAGKVSGSSELRVCFGKSDDLNDCIATGTITRANFKIFGVPISGKGTFGYDGNRLTVREFAGNSCGGSVTGMFYTEDSGSRVEVAGENVRLGEVMREMKLQNDLSGTTSFSSAFETKLDKPGFFGDWQITVKDGLLTSAPGVMSVVTLLGLPSFGKHEFTDGSAKMQYKGTRIVVDEAKLVSKKITLRNGNGYVDFDGNMHMQFDIYSEGSLLSLILGKFGSAIANLIDPVSKVFKVDITGTINEPISSLKAFSKKVDLDAPTEPIPEEPKDNPQPMPEKR